MKAFFTSPDGKVEVEFTTGETILQCMLKNGYHPDSIVIFKDGQCIPEDTQLEDSVEYKLVMVASGG